MRKRLNNNSGMILAIVTAMVIIMSIIVVGMVSRNFSSSLSSEGQKRHIEAEQVASAAFWNAYQQMGAGGSPSNYTQVVDGRSYSITYTIVPGAGPGGTNSVTVGVTY